MLSFRSQGHRLCDGVTRREVFRAGGLGALGLTLPQLLQSRATASPTTSGGKAKNCIVLFMLGGPPQH